MEKEKALLTEMQWRFSLIRYIEWSMMPTERCVSMNKS